MVLNVTWFPLTGGRWPFLISLFPSLAIYFLCVALAALLVHPYLNWHLIAQIQTWLSSYKVTYL